MQEQMLSATYQSGAYNNNPGHQVATITRYTVTPTISTTGGNMQQTGAGVGEFEVSHWLGSFISAIAGYIVLRLWRPSST